MMYLSIFLCFFFAASSSLFTQLASTPEIRKAIPLNESLNAPLTNTINEVQIAPITSHDPTKAKEAQFAVAEGFYQRKEYEIASVEFQKFLQLSLPGDRYREQALFHLAEAYRSLDKSLEAQSIYQQLLKETPSGDMAASASYRMGEYYHNKQELQKSIDAFSQAAQLTTNITIQNAARYQQGVCHDELGDQEKAAMLFDEVSKTTEDKITRATALMLLANEDEKLGRSKKALNAYLKLSTDSPPKLTAEALVKAGIIYSQHNNKEQALQLFEKAAALKEADPWNATAALHLMQLAYDAKDYQKVLGKSSQSLTSSNPEEYSQALLLTAQAERQLSHFQQALELTNRLLKEFPGSASAHDAAYASLAVAIS